jgi:hypothetical protein
MVECTELRDKVIRSFRLYEDGPYGPEVSVTFQDGTVFTVGLKSVAHLHNRLTEKQDREGRVLVYYDAPVSQH